MEDLEKIDPFEGQDEHTLQEANKDTVKNIKIKAKYYEDAINQLLKHIENVFEDGNIDEISY